MTAAASRRNRTCSSSRSSFIRTDASPRRRSRACSPSVSTFRGRATETSTSGPSRWPPICRSTARNDFNGDGSILPDAVHKLFSDAGPGTDRRHLNWRVWLPYGTAPSSGAYGYAVHPDYGYSLDGSAYYPNYGNCADGDANPYNYGTHDAVDGYGYTYYYILGW